MSVLIKSNKIKKYDGWKIAQKIMKDSNGWKKILVCILNTI